jgi:protein-glucosylgalactosylhydroxylysine glucosidase
MNQINSILFLVIFSFSVVNAQDNWSVTATDTANYHHCFLGNGIVGIRTHKSGLKTNEIYLNGLYDSKPGGYPTLTNYYKPLDISVAIKGIGTIALDRNVSNWSQMIQLKEAILYTNYQYANKLKLKCRMAALRNNPTCTINSVEFEALNDVELTVSNAINLPDRSDVKNVYETSMGFKKYQAVPVMYSVLPNLSGFGCISGANAYYFSGTEPNINYTNPTKNSQQISFTIALKKGQKYTFTIVASSTHNGFTADPVNDAIRTCAREYSQGFERLLTLHKQSWERLWQNDIQIESNDNAQRDVRIALYSLYSSIKEGMGLSIPPCGVSSDAWGAHIFWDAELWMYPPLLVMNGEFAQSMLDFRHNTKTQCKKRAALYGYKGIMFPWESDMEGNELCTINYKADMNEHHVTADVGIAFWNYYLVSQDKIWLKEKGFPMLKDIADFWTSRSEKGLDGKYHILNVIGPDEYHEDVNDNAFTNGAAKHCLNVAIQAAQILNEKSDTNWRNVADNMMLLSAKEGHTLQYQGYKGETIKQADVNLLSYPLNIISDKMQIIKDLEYYESKIDPNGPAMAHCILATIYARLGNIDKAYKLFSNSYTPNLKKPFYFMAESPNNTNMTFCTGYGGMLQTVIYGFAGLHITEKGLVQKNPILPKNWKSLVIKLGNRKYEVR